MNKSLTKLFTNNNNFILDLLIIIFFLVLLCLLQIDAFASDYVFASPSELAGIQGEIDGHFSLAYK